MQGFSPVCPYTHVKSHVYKLRMNEKRDNNILGRKIHPFLRGST